MFDNMLTIEKVISYYDNDDFAFIVFKSGNEYYYGFNLGNKNKCDAAFEILEDKDDFTVIGWKVARKIPKCVNIAGKWNMRNTLEDINQDEEHDDVDEKDDDDDDAMNDKELEENKQEGNHEDEVDIYNEDSKNDHKDVEMVEEEENKNNYKMKTQLKCF
jgi:hypothetical protein